MELLWSDSTKLPRFLDVRFQRQALWIWYRGGAFHGFQWQKDGRSVQQAIEEAWRSVGIGARPMGAGRTDRGVHARMQVVLLKTSKEVEVARVVEAMNSSLGPDGGVALAKASHESFHPQWSAIGKEYRYRLWLGAGEPPAHVWKVNADRAALVEAISEVVGTYDFSALHAKGSTVKPRTIHRAEVTTQRSGVVEVQLAGDSFARYQVRILVGTAALVAAGKLSREAFRAAIREQKRVDGQVAPADGLTLWSVEYPKELDPFTADERRRAAGVPASAPFEAD